MSALANQLKGDTEQATETRARKKTATPKSDPIMVCLFMADKGTTGLNLFNGVYTLLMAVDDSPKPKRQGRKGDVESMLDGAQELTLKPGSLFLRKSVAEKVQTILEETQQAKAGDGRPTKIFSIVCEMRELPNQPETLQLQIIKHSWDVPFLTEVFSVASDDLAAAADERIKFINQLGSEDTTNRLPATNLKI